MFHHHLIAWNTSLLQTNNHTWTHWELMTCIRVREIGTLPVHLMVCCQMITNITIMTSICAASDKITYSYPRCAFYIQCRVYSRYPVHHQPMMNLETAIMYDPLIVGKRHGIGWYSADINYPKPATIREISLMESSLPQILPKPANWAQTCNTVHYIT